MPIQPAAQNSPIPTSGPTITLASGENMELSWQERALCAQTDPEAFFQKRVAPLVKQSAYVFHAMFVQSVLSTH
jgi:hypothetical protein